MVYEAEESVASDRNHNIQSDRVIDRNIPTVLTGYDVRSSREMLRWTRGLFEVPSGCRVSARLRLRARYLQD